MHVNGINLIDYTNGLNLGISGRYIEVKYQNIWMNYGKLHGL